MVEVLRQKTSSIEQFRARPLPALDSDSQTVSPVVSFVDFFEKVRALRLGIPEGTPVSVFDSEEVIDNAIKKFGEGRVGKTSRLLVESGATCESKTPEGHQCTNACVCAINIDIGGMEDNFPACREHVVPLMRQLVDDVASSGMPTTPGINGHFRA